MNEKSNTSTVEKRMKVIRLAEELGNVSEACRICNMNRSSFYSWKRRYDEYGFDGLNNLPSTPKSNPRTTPGQVAKRIVEISLEHPQWGCIRVAQQLQTEGTAISSPTVQKILIKNQIATIKDRWCRLEELFIQGEIDLDEGRLGRMERLNPAFQERDFTGTKPGELISGDIYLIGYHPALGAVYLSVAVDSYTSLAFAAVSTNDSPEIVATLLNNQVFPFLRTAHILVEKVLTSAGARFSSQHNPLKTYLRINGVQHLTTRDKVPKTNGHADRFKQACFDMPLKSGIRSGRFGSTNEINQRLSAWLEQYNATALKSFPNFGRSPKERYDLYLQAVTQQNSVS